MAEIFLSPLLQVILDRLASTATVLFGELHDFKKNVQKLQTTLPRIQAVLEDADDQHITDKATVLWFSTLKDAVYRAEGLLDDLTHASELRPSMLQQTEDAHELNNLVLEIEKLANSAYEYRFKESRVCCQTKRASFERQSGSIVIESQVHGRQQDKEKIIELLIDPCIADHHVSVIPIVGIGGLGKTTLAQLVYNDEMVSKHFELKMWVCVSQDFNVKTIMKEAIESGTKSKCEISGMDALQSHMVDILSRKRYLMVLDDVWNEDSDEWEKLTNLLARGTVKGGRVIVTTRSEKVASIMGTTSFYHLNGLGEDDCWTIFKQRAFSNPIEEMIRDSNLLLIGKKIVKKCGGVPLAAKTLGSLMRFKREEREWLHVQSSELWSSIGDSQTGILPALRLSYSHLPLHLKRCFAFCSILPKSYHINKDKLIHLWMAEDFIQSETLSQSFRRPEDIGNEYFNDLLAMSFFEVVKRSDDGSVTGLKMHDLIHDLARSIGANEIMILEHGHLHLQSEYLALTRHVSVSFHINSFPNALYEAKHLQTLLFLSGGDLRDNAQFSRFKHLRVLDLSHCGITVLHESIGDLLFLKYLDLSYNQINKLPTTICKLQRLQTLNLSGCFNLMEFPDFMATMGRLRHLNLTGCLQLARMPLGIGELYKLQTLPIYIVDTPGGSISQLGYLHLHGELKIKHLGKLNDPLEARQSQLHTMENLELLGLYWRDIDDESVMESDVASLLKKERPSSSVPSEQHEHDAALGEEVISGLQPHENLKRFLLREYPGTKFPVWIPRLQKLIVVDLRNCNRCQCLPTLGKLPLLKILTLHGMNGVKQIGKEFYGENVGHPIASSVILPGERRPSFQSLKELTLIDFPSLEEWSSPDGQDAFHMMSRLIINRCPNLKAMPFFSSLQHLELRDCSASLLNSTEISTSISVFIIEKVPGLLSLSGELLANKSSLKSLEVISCPELQSLPSELGNLTALKSLTIRWCEKLSSLPQGLQNLTALESLEISDCHSLTALSDDQIGSLSSLRILSIENCTNLSSLPTSLRCLTSLEHLTVMYCPGLDSLPEDLDHLLALHSLTIISSPKFLCLPQGLQHVKTLHRLEIRSCPDLMALPEHVENLASLRSLAISDCPNLKHLPDGLKLLTALQHLSIQDCPELEERCTQGRGEDWPKIAHIPHKCIGSPESRQSSTAGSSTST